MATEGRQVTFNENDNEIIINHDSCPPPKFPDYLEDYLRENEDREKTELITSITIATIGIACMYLLHF
jgi:hypothetical protein